MQCYKNSGWLYYVGDSIFGDVLLVNADGLFSVCEVYASSVTLIDDPSIIVDVDVPIDGFDCVIVNATEGTESNISEDIYYFSVIKDDGLIAIMRDIDSDIAGLINIKYPWFFIKGLFKSIVKKYKEVSLSGYDVSNYYIRSVGGVVRQVLYKNGYNPVKNTFLFKEKVRRLFLAKYIYPLFSSNVLTIVKRSNATHTTVVDNIVCQVEKETGIRFKEIIRSSIIPFKVLVSAKAENSQKYIFLLLRGSDSNVRANKELEMIDYVNATYPELSIYLSESLVHGFYKNLEYIVYRELPGVNIDADFDRFKVAELSAFNKLVSIGEITQKTILIDEKKYNELFGLWLKKLKRSKESDTDFGLYIDDLNCYIFSKLKQTNCLMVLFHGDYKIENIIFDENDYSVTGIIDWDLSEKIQFPIIDLLYFILYSRRICNNSSFIEECESVFLSNGFLDNEKEMIASYCNHFSISSGLFDIACVLFLWHHFSSRECGDFEGEWLIRVMESIRSGVPK